MHPDLSLRYGRMVKLLRWIQKEAVLVSFLSLLLVLAILYPEKVPQFPSFVDSRTMVTLTGLLLLTTGLKESGYFDLFARILLERVSTERRLGIFFVLLSSFLSTFLTNDISLFVVVPLVVSMEKFVKDLSPRLIVFSAMGVNVGSTLTPVGNPQNIYLWQRGGLSFVEFVRVMFPLVALLLGVLLLFAWFVFPPKPVSFSLEGKREERRKKGLFWISLSFFLLFLLSIEFHQGHFFLGGIFLTYLFFFRDLLRKVDWLLLFLFAVIFIDFHLVGLIPPIREILLSSHLEDPSSAFLFSSLLSQVISNVPATALLTQFTSSWLPVAYGVNVGGNGFFLGSLANLIALRMGGRREVWLLFHRYSLPYFLITLFLTYFWFFF
jgi:Na+/H+ antiporter NhaD/arsenite permease-like protein